MECRGAWPRGKSGNGATVNWSDIALSWLRRVTTCKLASQNREHPPQEQMKRGLPIEKLLLEREVAPVPGSSQPQPQ